MIFQTGVTYMVVPCTYDQAKLGEFLLYVKCEDPLVSYEITEKPPPEVFFTPEEAAQAGEAAEGGAAEA